MVFAYNYIYYVVRCLYTLHMYTANCLLLHMLSYYQVIFLVRGSIFRANLFGGDLQDRRRSKIFRGDQSGEARSKRPSATVWSSYPVLQRRNVFCFFSFMKTNIVSRNTQVQKGNKMDKYIDLKKMYHRNVTLYVNCIALNEYNYVYVIN